MHKKAVIIFSGGLDSTTCLALAKSKGFNCYTLSFDYNQRHRIELSAAARISKLFEAFQHIEYKLPIDIFKQSALTDLSIKIPEHKNDGQIPITYVPARNTIFLSIALGLAEAINAQDIFIGISAVDYSSYPDCRPEYLEAFQKLACLATKAGVEGKPINIHAPLLHLSKAETIQLGASLNVDYSYTISCYQADEAGKACGFCDSCSLRKMGFAKAGVADPTLYSI